MPTEIFEGNVYEDGQQFQDDKRLMVRFFMKAIKSEFRSEQEGRPIFVDIAYIEVITPGSRDTLVTEATPHYQQRFSVQWANFKARVENPVTGTPLKEVPWLTVSQVAELNSLNVLTVEQLVALPDALAQRVMGSFQLREKAQRFLDAAAGEAIYTKQEADLRARDEQIAALSTKLDDALAQIGRLTANEAAKKVPGTTVKA